MLNCCFNSLMVRLVVHMAVKDMGLDNSFNSLMVRLVASPASQIHRGLCCFNSLMVRLVGCYYLSILGFD